MLRSAAWSEGNRPSSEFRQRGTRRLPLQRNLHDILVTARARQMPFRGVHAATPKVPSWGALRGGVSVAATGRAHAAPDAAGQGAKLQRIQGWAESSASNRFNRNDTRTPKSRQHEFSRHRRSWTKGFVSQTTILTRNDRSTIVPLPLRRGKPSAHVRQRTNPSREPRTPKGACLT